MKPPQPKLFKTKPRIPQSVEPKRNTEKIGNSEERRLLLQVIEEAKLFRKPKLRETPGQ